MKPSRIGELCEICGSPGSLASHIAPDSFFRERREGPRVIRERHVYCRDDYERIMTDFWSRVSAHLL